MNCFYRSILFTVLFFTGFALSLASQTWLSATSVYGPGMDEILCVQTDNEKNVYIGGRFRDTVFFSAVSFLTAPTNYYDGFIAKYDSSGSFLWARKFGGNHNDHAAAIDIDDSGYVYVACYARSSNTVTYDSFSYTGTGNDKTFIIKIDPQGNLIWGKLLTAGISNAQPSSISVNAGLLAVAGTFAFLNLIIETDTLFHAGSDDVFLAVYDAVSGNLMWTKALTAQFQAYGRDVEVDNSGNVYLSGIFNSSLNIGGADTLYSPSSYEVFLCKHSSSGNYLWSVRYNGSGSHTADGLAISPYGDIYIAGWLGSNSHTLNDTSFNLFTTHNFYLQKISPAGNSLWTRIYSGGSLGRIIGIASDKNDNVFLAGYLGSSYTFGTYQVSGSSSNYRSFIAKISGIGNAEHALVGGNRVNNSGFKPIATDVDGNAYMVGYFGSAAGHISVFGNDTLVSADSRDGYLVKYGHAVSPPCNVSAAFSSSHSHYCTGDTGVFISNSLNATQFQWLINGVPTANQHTLNQVFNLPGNINIQLIASNTICSDTASLLINVDTTLERVFWDTICQGDTLLFGSNVCTTSGTYFVNHNVAGGCDSLHIMHLKVNTSSQQNIFDTISCGDTVYLYNGQLALYSGGVYTETLQNMQGCDSVTILNLWVDTLERVLWDTICQGDTLLFGPNVCTTSGTYFVNYSVAGGCDSLHIMHLKVNSSSLQNIFDTICRGDTIYLYHGQLPLYSSGIYTETLQNMQGCDSVTILNLWVDTLNASFYVHGDSAVAPTGYHSYQWLVCDSVFLEVSGANSEFFVPAKSGYYTVVLSNQVCTDTAQCKYILISNIERYDEPGKFVVYPNPASDFLNIKLPPEIHTCTAGLYTLCGRLILSTKLNSTQNRINLSSIGNGVYLLNLTEENGNKHNFMVIISR